MSRSIQEEIIGVLWTIAALLAFGNGYSIWGWIFAIKAGLDCLTSILFAIQEAKAKLARLARRAG